MTTPPFVHLHCHSHYSLLDGASPIDELVERAKELGMNALAITDHGNLYGALEFYQACQATPASIRSSATRPTSRPAAGSSKSASEQRRSELPPDAAGPESHRLQEPDQALQQGVSGGLLLQAADRRELLAAHSEGLICLSGCVSGEFSRALLSGNTADEAIAARRRTSPPGSTACSATVLHRDPEQRPRDPAAGAGAVGRRSPSGWACRWWPRATPTTCGARTPSRRTCCCASTRASSAPTRTGCGWRATSSILRSPEEMYAAFPGPGRRGRAAARRSPTASTSSWNWASGTFPSFHCRRSKTPNDYLRELCLDGPEGALRRRAEHAAATASCRRVVLERLEHELDVINKLGFANYFLIVWDFVRYARERGIPATARGSGVGSLVSLRAEPQPRLPAASTTCCSSGSSTRTAAKRPISTSTSARTAAARSSSTSRTSTARRTSPRSARSARWRPRRRSATSAACSACRSSASIRSWRWCPTSWASRSTRRSKQSAELKQDLRHRRRDSRADRPGDEDRGPGPQRRHARGGGGDRRQAARPNTCRCST